jgi:hypothetical protein
MLRRNGRVGSARAIGGDAPAPGGGGSRGAPARRLAPPHRLRVGLLCGWALLLVLALGMSQAEAAEATEPPVLESLSVTPSTVNTTTSSQTVTATAHITDSGGPGVSDALLALFSPSRHQQVEPGLHLVSGTDTNGIYEGTLVIPEGSETGTWKARMRILDIQGHETSLEAPELETLGFPNSIEVEGLAPATGPPVIESLSITPSAVNTTTSAQTVTATAHITDSGGPGVSDALLALFSPSRHQQVEPGLHLVSGTSTNGIYEGTLVIPEGSEAGAWKARMRILDIQGHETSLEAPELETDGFPNTVEVEDSTGDSDALARPALEPAVVAQGPQVVVQEQQKAAPFAGAAIASNTLLASPSGTVSIAVSAPPGENCTGTVTLRTLTAASANTARSIPRKHKAAGVILAVGSFTVHNGSLTTVKLHLSAKGRALLARTHLLHAQATIVARDSTGATRTTQATVTLRLPKALTARA